VQDEYPENEWVVQERSPNGVRHHRLPRSTYAAFAAARPARVRNGYAVGATTLQDHIGPSQLENGRLWFGKTFYDGEGFSGIGGFGYFDPVERQFRLFTPSILAHWSVSAIYLQPDAIWLALAHRGELGDSSGGVLRFDRVTEAFDRFDIKPAIGQQFVAVGKHLLLATDAGITVLEPGAIRHYFVDRTTDGRLRIASVAK
jgi:hypothetical protein